MNVTTRAFGVLEFDKIKKSASTLTATSAGADLMLSAIPSVDSETVQRLLSETEEAYNLLTLKGSPPLSGAIDVTEAVERSCKNAVLTTGELLKIVSLLQTASGLKRYAADRELPMLGVYFNELLENRGLCDAITNAVAAEDLIADSASDDLYRIRRDIRKAESAVREKLSQVTGGSMAKYLQEPIVTMRSGRFVVPVKSEFKNEIKGIVHDSSASGATLFVEPMAVLEQNNRLRDLKGREVEEIERILAELSSRVALSSRIILVDCKVCAQIDYVFARASYAFEINGSRPIVGGNAFRLVRARHPLISKDKVVPISVSFGADTNTMIITGPNTGGKTVTLKTLGLLSMMAQSGFFVPADDGTSLPLFTEVLADIGDEQSIEQSLSTFSSHMVNIVDIMSACTEHSLVLFDELGAGTDPVEGAALAIAILEYVRAKGAVIAATTHYSELKLYALDTDGVLNASCEFDLETLKPTYRLITGMPGRSNAFAIASRLGIYGSVIDRAKQLIADDNIKFEDVIVRLEQTEQKLEHEKNTAQATREKADKLIAESEKKAREMLDKAQVELDRSRLQAQRIVAAAKASSEFVFSQLGELKKSDAKALEKARIEEARKAIGGRIEQAEAETSVDDKAQQFDEDYKLPRPLKPGDKVYLVDIGKSAVVKSISGKNIICAFGKIETKTNEKNLRLLNDAGSQKNEITAKYDHSTANVRNEIDVRGNVGDDAWFMIDRWLDDAILAGFSTVTVIHGKGTGALRAALWQYFRGDKRIKSFRSGRYGEGETGVTVIELKN